MKQPITKYTVLCGYGGSTQYWPLSGVQTVGWTSSGSTFTNGCHPWSAGGTLRNLVIHLPVAQAQSATYTVVIAPTPSFTPANTALTVTIPAGQTDGQDVTHSATIAAGDLVALKFSGTSGSGFDMAYALEFESTSPGVSCYGLDGFSAGTNSIGGAFGNGVFSGYGGGAYLSSTFSLDAIAGSVTRLDLHTFANGFGMGDVFDGYLAVNGVLQDGSGMTVDTKTTITGGTNVSNSSTFDLPVVPTDKVDVYFTLSSGSISFSESTVAAGVAFTATTDGESQLCGGSVNTVSHTATTYRWVENGVAGVAPTDETLARTPVGASNVEALGLYTFMSGGVPPNQGIPGGAFTYTLRDNLANTAITETITSSVSGSIVESVLLRQGDAIDLQIAPANSPNHGAHYWGLAVSTHVIGPTKVYPLRRLRRFALPYNENLRQFFRRLEIIAEMGVGLTTGQGSDPQLMIRISQDGGHTWGPERWVPLGKIGEYRRRAFLTRLGSGRNPVCEVVISDPVYAALLEANLTVTEGTS